MNPRPGTGDPVQVLFEGVVHVHYGFLALRPRGSAPVDPGQEYAGQRNGLVGARQVGALAMRAGTHTGPVPVRIEFSAQRPSVADGWEDVVEVPFAPAGTVYALTAFDFGADVVVPLTAGRARWCAAGMDPAHQEPAAPPDRYLLQIWPADPAPEEVVREGSAQARYWADVAQRAYPTDLPPAEEWVGRDGEDPRQVLRDEMRRRLREPWRAPRPAPAPPSPSPRPTRDRRAPGPGAGGGPRTGPPAVPTRETVTAMRARLSWLQDTRPDLVARLTAAPRDDQRAVAAWAARRLAVAAGAIGDDDVAAVLDAVRDRRPAPSVDRDRLRWHLVGDDPGSLVGPGDPVRAPDAPSTPGAAAFLAVVGTTAPDPARAVVDVVTVLVRQADDRDRAVADVEERLLLAAAGTVPDEERGRPTPADRERAAAAHEERERSRAADRARARDRVVWGPETPSAPLRRAPGNAAWLSQHHHVLAERLAQAPVEVRRAIAGALVRRAVAGSGLGDDPAAGALLRDLLDGRPVAPGDRGDWWARSFPGRTTLTVTTLTVTTGTPPLGRPSPYPRAVALDALLLAAEVGLAESAVGVAAGLLLGAPDPGSLATEITALLDEPPGR